MIDTDFTIYRKISFVSSAIALIIGAVVILGWVTHTPILTSLSSVWVAMKVNTALGFVLAGTAILFLLGCDKSSESSIYRWPAKICAITLLLVGGLTVIEYMFSLNLGIDELFLKQEEANLGVAIQGRMSPFTAVMQVNFAIALLLLSNTEKKNLAITLAQYCGFVGGAIGLLAFMGYFLNAKELYSPGHNTAIAVHTAIGFILVSIGILFLQPQLALMRTFTSQTRTGQILRRFVPLALWVPILIGWLRLKGQQIGLYSFESGVAFMVTFCIVSWEAGIFWITRKFQAIELALAQHEEQLRGQAELLNLTHDAIIVRELDGKIAFWNSGAEKMYGYLQAEAMGKTVHELLQTKFPIERKNVEFIALETGKWEGELTHQTKNEQPIIVASRWSVKKNETGKPTAFLEINNDISAAKEADKQVSEFYSTVSHELRTPLTSMKGVFSLLAGGRVGDLSARAAELVTMGLGETERLIRLINDILDIKKIEAGKIELNLANIEPKELVEQTIITATGFAEEYKVKLVAEIGDNNLIRGDKDRLIQILTNLISNAIKFSDAGQTVTVNTAAGGKVVRFSITDKGPGIDPRNVPKLFRMFQQVGSADQPKGGTGLGLAICKSLVEQHGGSVGIDTELGKGSTFWFEIPCA